MPPAGHFPATKTLDEFDLAASSVSPATFHYLASLEWIRGAENRYLIGPGTLKTHLLLALGSAAVNAGHRVRCYSAADLVDTLHRGLADNSVGKIIDTLALCNRLGVTIVIKQAGYILTAPAPAALAGMAW
jgi:DNA replication protein DnaC